MRSADDLAQELEEQREHLEERWCLPWYRDRQLEPVWEDPRVVGLDALDDDALDEVVDRLLASGSFALRGVALHLVAGRRLTAHREHVLNALSDESLHIRALSVVVIGALRDLDGVELLLETKDTEHPEVKKSIVDALRTIRDTRSIPLLARWVGRVGEDDELRLKACQALGSIGDDAAMPVLARVMDDGTVAAEVRSAATMAVGAIGGAEAKRLLLNALLKGRSEVRCLCVDALLVFQDAGVTDALATVVLEDDDARVRLRALQAVFTNGGRTATRLARKALEDDDGNVRSLACEALGALDVSDAAMRGVVSCLDDAEESVRMCALLAFSKMCGKTFGPSNGEVLEVAVSRARDHAATLFSGDEAAGESGA